MRLIYTLLFSALAHQAFGQTTKGHICDNFLYGSALVNPNTVFVKPAKPCMKCAVVKVDGEYKVTLDVDSCKAAADSISWVCATSAGATLSQCNGADATGVDGKEKCNSVNTITYDVPIPAGDRNLPFSFEVEMHDGQMIGNLAPSIARLSKGATKVTYPGCDCCSSDTQGAATCQVNIHIAERCGVPRCGLSAEELDFSDVACFEPSTPSNGGVNGQANVGATCATANDCSSVAQPEGYAAGGCAAATVCQDYTFLGSTRKRCIFPYKPSGESCTVSGSCTSTCSGSSYACTSNSCGGVSNNACTLDSECQLNYPGSLRQMLPDATDHCLASATCVNGQCVRTKREGTHVCRTPGATEDCAKTIKCGDTPATTYHCDINAAASITQPAIPNSVKYYGSETTCRIDNRNACLRPQVCSGTTTTCPQITEADYYTATENIQCRSENTAGVCEAAVKCAGAPPVPDAQGNLPAGAIPGTVGQAYCPYDAANPTPISITGRTQDSLLCRAKAGACDVVDYCTGSNTCADEVRGADYVCAASPDYELLNGIATLKADASKSQHCWESTTLKCSGTTTDKTCPTPSYSTPGAECKNARLSHILLPANVCDLPDTCGADGVCANDEVRNNDYVCAASPDYTLVDGIATLITNDDDKVQHCWESTTLKCSGESGANADKTCPTPTKSGANAECKNARLSKFLNTVTNPCDAADTCDASGACTNDNVEPSTTVCEAIPTTPNCWSAPRTCAGADATGLTLADKKACPAAVPKAAQASCNNGRQVLTANVCDREDVCTGDLSCPDRKWGPKDSLDANGVANGKVCRPAYVPIDGATTCDLDDYCNGSTDGCSLTEVPDIVKEAGTMCRDIPADLIGADGSVTKSCDKAERCGGRQGANGERGDFACPTDEVQDSSFVCRADYGATSTALSCDVAETCRGGATSDLTKQCPQNGFKPAGTVCRGDDRLALDNYCDVKEVCTGTATCPSTDRKQIGGYALKTSGYEFVCGFRIDGLDLPDGSNNQDVNMDQFFKYLTNGGTCNSASNANNLPVVVHLEWPACLYMCLNYVSGQPPKCPPVYSNAEQPNNQQGLSHVTFYDCGATTGTASNMTCNSKYEVSGSTLTIPSTKTVWYDNIETTITIGGQAFTRNYVGQNVLCPGAQFTGGLSGLPAFDPKKARLAEEFHRNALDDAVDADGESGSLVLTTEEAGAFATAFGSGAATSAGLSASNAIIVGCVVGIVGGIAVAAAVLATVLYRKRIFKAKLKAYTAQAQTTSTAV